MGPISRAAVAAGVGVTVGSGLTALAGLTSTESNPLADVMAAPSAEGALGVSAPWMIGLGVSAHAGLTIADAAGRALARRGVGGAANMAARVGVGAVPVAVAGALMGAAWNAGHNWEPPRTGWWR